MTVIEEETPKKENWINPVQGMITSSCGVRENPVLKKTELHDGLDIAVKKDTPVKATRSGTVTEVRKSSTLGNLVKFETEDGFTIMYAHLNKALVQEGQKVAQGETVALSGDTGLVTGPHLHYSVWKKDMLIDPMQFVYLEYTDEVKEEYAARGVPYY